MGTAPDPALFLDADWYRAHLLMAADLWDGGLDGNSGMGAFSDGFDGFFHVNLDRQWRQTRLRFSSTVAQSRAIYMNVEAYRAADDADKPRFLAAINAGVGVLLNDFLDPQYGGFFWEVSPNGVVVDPMKQGYGNVHPVMALAQAYAVTQNPEYLNAALTQLDLINEKFLDPAYDCAYLPGFSRDFSQVIGVNNVDTFTHLFESLLTLYDVTDGARHDAIAQEIDTCGNFLINTLYRDQEGFTDRGYVAYNYDEQWSPSQIPYTRENQWSGGLQASTGHNIELAYLLSRAVERGFNADWLDTADKLIKFCTEYALDSDTGGMIYEITDYNGQPLQGNPDNAIYIYWPQAETSRALLHFIVVRGHDEYRDMFKQVESLFDTQMTDQEYGGLYHALDAESLTAVGPEKGDIWKTNYHYSMFFSEVLRLAANYPDRIAELNGAS